jgi:arabinogalactan endo-1,4-beta-galactosidase
VSIYRVYKEEVSPYVRKDGLRLVKHYGCNGVRHVIIYFHLICNRNGTKVAGGTCDVRPPKHIGKCTHEVCRNLGGFILDS